MSISERFDKITRVDFVVSSSQRIATFKQGDVKSGTYIDHEAARVLINEAQVEIERLEYQIEQMRG